MKKPIRKTQGKHFYSHIVDTSSISLSLGDMALSQVERIHLVSLVESQLHHTVLDAVLSELSEEDKKIFLKHVALSAHDKVWELLYKKVENIEEKIQKAGEALKKQLHDDMKGVHKKTKTIS